MKLSSSLIWVAAALGASMPLEASQKSDLSTRAAKPISFASLDPRAGRHGSKATCNDSTQAGRLCRNERQDGNTIYGQAEVRKGSEISIGRVPLQGLDDSLPAGQIWVTPSGQVSFGTTVATRVATGTVNAAKFKYTAIYSGRTVSISFNDGAASIYTF